MVGCLPIQKNTIGTNDSVPCSGLKVIRYSPKDTNATKKQCYVQNKVIEKFCSNENTSKNNKRESSQ